MVDQKSTSWLISPGRTDDKVHELPYNTDPPSEPVQTHVNASSNPTHAKKSTRTVSQETADTLPENEARMYRSISGALLDGKLRPGTPLRERSLAEMFDATRTAVRKVLARLEREGKVELRQNRGAFVPEPSLEDIHSVYDARRALESGILMLLARRLSADEIARLQEHVSQEEHANQRKDREESIRLAGAFHVLLARMLGNEELEAFLQRLLARTQLFVALYEPHAQSSCACGEHRAIVDALSQGEARSAIDTMLHHLDEIETRLTRRISQADQPDLNAILSGY